MIRNKTLIKGFALVVFMPLFAACSNEEDATVPGGEPQEVQVSISTRATADGDTWTWQNGDAINLYVMGYGSTSPTTRTLTYINGASWTTFNVTLPATVEACYPETATLTSFTIPDNQSAGIAAADYMTTVSSQQLNGTNLSLTLEHRLCKVIVTINDYIGYTDTPTVANERFSSYPTISYSDGGWTGTGSITNNITPFKTESNADGKHTYQAIVAPASSYEPFMTLTVNGRSRTVNCEQALVSGNAYTFTLTVSNNELTLTPTDVLPGWGAANDEEII